MVTRVDVLAAMEMIGWSSFAMVKRYGITDEGRLKEQAAKMEKRG